ncbi:hypothetical protein FACS189479_09330 [Spirochaetia bacterium]|nr:hypothetical protein FACS189479_09330 [Spirochaetia bacterium]
MPDSNSKFNHKPPTGGTTRTTRTKEKKSTTQEPACAGEASTKLDPANKNEE